MEFVSQLEKTNNTTTNNNTTNTHNNAMFMSPLEFSKPHSDPDRSQIALENWLQLYHRNHFSQSNDQAMQMGTSNSINGVIKSNSNAELSNSTVVTTKTLPIGSLCVNSAPAKVSKKRSRASRRAPTTLLSTDTSNFRAMVQQFTGIPESPFALGRSFAPTSSLLQYNTHPPQRYSPLRFHDDLNANPFFFPRATASQAQPPPPPPLLDEIRINPAAASLFSSPGMLSSERRPGYLI